MRLVDRSWMTKFWNISRGRSCILRIGAAPFPYVPHTDNGPKLNGHVKGDVEAKRKKIPEPQRRASCHDQSPNCESTNGWDINGPIWSPICSFWRMSPRSSCRRSCRNTILSWHQMVMQFGGIETTLGFLATGLRWGKCMILVSYVSWICLCACPLLINEVNFANTSYAELLAALQV